MGISFIYKFLGTEYSVDAVFSVPEFRASMSGPYDDEITVETIEVIGFDGEDYSMEMDDIFTRRHGTGLKLEMVSILDLIEEEALEKFEQEIEQ